MRPSLTGTNHCTCYGETGHVQNKFLLGPVSAAPPLFCLPPKPSRDQRDSKKHSADTHTSQTMNDLLRCCRKPS